MKTILRVIGILAAALLVAAVALPFLIDANQFRPKLQTEATMALGREVRLGDLKLSLLSGGVTATDLSIADDPAFSKSPFVQAKSLAVSVELVPLIFSRKINVTGITIDQPDIALLQSPSGAWNFSSLGAHATRQQAQPLDVRVDLLKITNGRLSLGRTGGKTKPQVLEKVNIEVRDFSAASQFPFTLTAAVAGGGDIKLNGKAGPIDMADAAMTPLTADLNVARLNPVDAGFLEASAGLGGLISLDGTVASSKGKVQTKGRIKAEQLKLARGGTPAKKLVEFDFAVDHDMQKHAGSLSRGGIFIGQAKAALVGTYTMQDEVTALNMKLSGPSMPVGELEGMLPALGIVLPAGSSLQGGMASAELTAVGPLDKLVIDGTVGLRDTTLAGFDLGSKMSAVAKLAGIKAGPNTKIQSLSVKAHVSPEGVRADEISLVAPDIADLGGSGTVSPTHQLDFRMRATLHTGGAVLATLGAKSQGGIPFLVKGTSENPSFEPDVKALAGQELKTLEKEPAKAATGILRGLLGGKKN